MLTDQPGHLSGRHELFSHVILTQAMSKAGPCRGDHATVVEQYPGAPGQEPDYELEVFNAVGDTVTVVSVPESQLEAPLQDERLCVRHASTVAGWRNLERSLHKSAKSAGKSLTHPVKSRDSYPRSPQSAPYPPRPNPHRRRAFGSTGAEGMKKQILSNKRWRSLIEQAFNNC